MRSNHTEIAQSMEFRWREMRGIVLSIFGLALVLRLTLLAISTHDPGATADSAIYIGIAHGIADTGEFVRKYENYYELVTERVPAYPALLALLFKFFGDELTVALVVQCVIDAMTCILIGMVGKKLNPRLFIPAGVLAAVNLNMAIHSTLILTDTLFLLLFVGFLLALINYASDPRTMSAVIASALLSLAILTRPLAYHFMPIFFILLVLLATLNHCSWKIIIRSSSAAITVALCLVGPQLLRNHSQFGYFELVSQSGSAAMEWYVPLTVQYATGENTDTVIQREKVRLEQLLQLASEEEIENPFFISKLQVSVAMEELVKLRISQIAYAWFGGVILNVFTPSITSLPALVQMKRPRFFDTEGQDFVQKTLNFLGHSDNRVYLVLVGPAILLTLLFRGVAIIGVVSNVTRPEVSWACLAILSIAGLYILAVTGPLVSAARYRLPLEPIFIVFTALGIVRLYDTWNDGRRGRRETLD